jgi:ABC-type lipoprotein export system ATPase subunit
MITGRNGSGKTSILKLIWSIISGNILRGLQEVEFSRAQLKTTEYNCTVYRLSRNTCKIDLNIGGRTSTYEDVVDSDGDVVVNAEDQVNGILSEIGGSVFFPTFRRIEGGFSIATSRQSGLSGRPIRVKSDLEEAMANLARNLTNNRHVFVSSISTSDIAALLLRQYADLSEAANSLQAAASQEIIQQIKTRRTGGDEAAQLRTATKILEEVRSRIEEMEAERQVAMAPMDEVRSLVERLFRNTGIRFGARLNFGDAATAVNSESLSAGEKQMLSFVCYNAFFKDSIILIDEPELSLHVDWQRQLFNILINQQTSNQFIVATHSPFIFNKYPDKELELSADRGDVAN